MFHSIDNARIAAIEKRLAWDISGVTPAQLQAALDAYSATGGGIVRLGPGTLALGSTTLNIDGNMILEGSGQGVTILTYTGSGTALQVNSGESTETLRCVVRNLTLDGTSNTTGGAYGITLGQNSTSPKTGAGSFENITVKRFSTAGVRIVISAINVFYRCTFELNDDGVWFDPAVNGGITTQNFIACRFNENLKRGCFIESSDSTHFTNNCQFEDNGEEGCLVKHDGNASTSMRLISFDNCYFETNGTSAANTYASLNWDTATSGRIIQNGAVRRCRFSGNPGTNVKHHIQFYQGRFLEEDNEFSATNTGSVNCRATSVCFLGSRSDADPAAYYTLGSTCPTYHVRGGASSGAPFRIYTNVSGTATERLGITNAAKPTVTGSRGGNAALASLLTALAGMNLVTDSSS